MQACASPGGVLSDRRVGAPGLARRESDGSAIALQDAAHVEKERSFGSLRQAWGLSPGSCRGARLLKLLDQESGLGERTRVLNRALHTIAITRARTDPATKAYLERKEAEGKTKKGALRCLKRHLARRFYRLLVPPGDDPKPAASDALARPRQPDAIVTLTAPSPMRCLK